MAFYSIATCGKAIFETFTIGKEIKKYENNLGSHLLEQIEGADRYRAAETLFALCLSDDLKASGTDSELTYRNKCRYLDQLWKEYAMSKDKLAKEPANKAEIVALGLALREVALCLEDELRKFRQDNQKLKDDSTLVIENQNQHFEIFKEKARGLFRQFDQHLQKIEEQAKDDSIKSVQKILIEQVTDIQESSIIQKNDFIRLTKLLKIGGAVLSLLLFINFIVIFLIVIK